MIRQTSIASRMPKGRAKPIFAAAGGVLNATLVAGPMKAMGRTAAPRAPLARPRSRPGRGLAGMALGGGPGAGRPPLPAWLGFGVLWPVGRPAIAGPDAEGLRPSRPHTGDGHDVAAGDEGLDAE